MTTIPRALLFLLLSTVSAHAATYQVNPSGSDSTPCGQGPRRTINAGIACLAGGDTLVMAPGTYHEIITHIPAGRPGAFTTLRAAQPGTVRLTATPQGEATALIELTSAQQHHIRIEGFELDGGNRMTTCAMLIQSHDLEMVQLDCHHAQQGFIGSSQRVAFLNTVSHDHGTNGCRGSGHSTEPGYCHGWYLQQTEANPGPWTFDGVWAYNNSGYGIQSYHGSNVVIQQSVFTDHHAAGVILVGQGGTVRNSCFARNLVPLLCDGCRQEGNRIDPPGGCGGAVPGPAPVPEPPPTPPQRPAPYNLRIVVAP